MPDDTAIREAAERLRKPDAQFVLGVPNAPLCMSDEFWDSLRTTVQAYLSLGERREDMFGVFAEGMLLDSFSWRTDARKMLDATQYPDARVVRVATFVKPVEDGD